MGCADSEDERRAHAFGAQGRAGAVLAVTLQGADKGDTTTLDETLGEAGMAAAGRVGRAQLRALLRDGRYATLPSVGT